MGSFLFHTKAALSKDAPGGRRSFIAEAYESVQLANGIQAGKTVSRLITKYWLVSQ